MFAIAFAAVLTLLAVGAVRQTAAQQFSARPKATGFAQQGNNAAANAMSSGGRHLIDEAQWAKAEDKFAQYISSYPKEKNLDAAMYWMAYSQYKLRKFNQSKETIDRLLKTYEKTTWKEDAELLLAQLPGAVTVKVDPITVNVDPVVATAVAAAVQEPIEVQVRSQEIQARIAEAQARAQERTREAQERMQERMAEAREKMKDKTTFTHHFNFD